MKKIFVTILTTVFFVCSTCFAGIYFSPFGFSVSISSHWEIINSKKLLEDPKYEDYFNRIFGHFSWISEKQRKEMIYLLKTGQVEYWCHRDAGNVNCRKVKGKGIVKHHEFKTYIKEFKKLLGSDAEVYNIGLKKIAGLDAFYSEYGGLVYGFKYLQFNIQITPKEYFQFTLTAPDDSFEVLKGEFWRIISTFKPF